MNIYVNGALNNGVLVGTIPTSQLNSSVNANIGRRTGGFNFNGLIDEVRIYNRVLSQAEIQSDMNTPVSAVADTQGPTTPTGLTATPVTMNEIDLTWTASSDNVGVTGYLVEACQGAGCSTFAQIGTASSPSFGATGLVFGATYSFRVRATDAANNLSAYSTIVTSTPAADTTPPTAPSNLTGSATNSSTIALTWTGSTDAGGLHGYSIERCLTASCTFTEIVPYITSTLFSDTGLTANTSYSYRVRASDSAGNLSSYSNIATAATPQVDNQPPTVPTGFTATASGNAQINLSWTASSDNVAVTAYLLERCLGSGCSSFSQIASLGNVSYSDTSLAAGTSYTYRVRARDAANNLSDYSTQASAITSSVTPGLISAYGFSEGSGTTTSDISGNGLTGALQNTTWTSAGRHGNAVNFDGVTSYVDLGTMSAFPLTSSATWSAWVFPTAQPLDDGQIIARSGSSDGWQLKTTPDTGVRTFGIAVSNGTSHAQRYSKTVLALNTWYHVAAVYNAASQTLDIYVNGVLDNGALIGGVPPSQSNPASINVNIGRRQGGFYFIGTIDDVRMYNRALSQNEIVNDMNTAVGSVPPGPAVTLGSTIVSFGNQATGSTSSPQSVSLTNSGTQFLAISDISVVGLHPGDFAQTNDCPSSLAPSAACTINMTFTPTTTGARAANVRITDNAPGSPHNISMTGTGVGFTVSPRVTVLTSSITQQFTTLNGSGNVTWLVDSIAGGSPTAGTINQAGLYSPPSTPGVHTVTATTTTSLSASATVYISNYAGTPTFHNDNLRSGLNSNETVLTPSNVNSVQFGKLFSYAIDGISHASPLYVANVNMAGGARNVVYVATEHDSVYALDADGRNSSPLWKVSFINPSANIIPVPPDDTGECCDISPEIGITSTPVIDMATNTLYVVAKTKEGNGGSVVYRHRLHALDLSTGAEKFGGPVILQASVPGTGAGSSGGVLQFDSLKHNQRPALLLSNGVIYIAFSSHGDHGPYHGWVLGYNATTLQRTFAYCDSPNGSQSGIWQSGMGPAADAAGNVYFTTANGTFNVNTGGTEYGDSVVKLGSSGSVVDYFTSKDQAQMDSNNWDFASSGAILLPDQPGSIPHLLIATGKIGSLYLVNRDNMGHFNNNDTGVVQALRNIFPNGSPEPGNYSAPVYFNGNVYIGPVNDQVQAFGVNNSLLTTSPTSKSAIAYAYPGASLAASASGTANGIIWAIQRNDSAVAEPSGNPAVLRAYLAGDLSNELYNSTQAGARDSLDPTAKFTIPLVANGRVYILTQGQLTAFGLLP
jgi:chitodextrinase